MSKFNLKLEIPTVNYSWYQTNVDGTPKCPANWTIKENYEFERYEYYSGTIWTLKMLVEESFKLPFKTNNIDDLTNRTFTFKHTCETTINTDDYLIQATFSDNNTDFVNMYFIADDTLQQTTFDIPSNAQYIKFKFYTNAGQIVSFHTDFEINMSTSNFDINTEQNNASISNNKSTSKSISGKLLTTRKRERDINYADNLIMKPTEEEEMKQLTRLAKFNKVLVGMYVNINDEASANLANIGSGGAENIVKYFYNYHKRTQQSGLYSYVYINYKRDINSNYIYI